MSLSFYEPPTIVRHQLGAMNKFGRLVGMQPMTHIDGVAVEELVEQYGSPLFVFSEKTLISRFRELRDAFSRRWSKVRIAWSYKTNYLEAVCRTFHKEGAWAEVVSPFEYDKAIASGVSPDRIHWNGPFKPEDALEKAIAGDSIVHLDNFDELAKMERIAVRLGKRARVAIRLNLSIEGITSWSRFGFSLESGAAKEAVARLISGNALELIGLHTHIGTFILEVDAYRDAARKVAAFANEIRKEHGVKLSFIDLGGGFASRNTLKAQYLMGEQASPSFARYAEAICEGLFALDVPAHEQPTLVLETGRALVDDAGYLISTVEANKRMPDGRRGVVLDAGVNLLFTAYWYKHDVVPAQPFGALLEPTVMFGPLCMNIDVVRDTFQFPAVAAGERVVFKNVGAYNVTQWHQFIALRPAIVMIGEGGRVGVIRRAEQVSDFQQIESLPAWMSR